MSPPSIALRGQVWLSVGDANFGGSGRIELLARIGECGSIRQAAKAVGMGYKAAWEAIDTMNTLAGEPLVAKLTGGRGGGGTRLTARGEQLVRNFRLIEREHRRFVEALERDAEGITDDALLIRRMAMKTSARNQFHGRVVALVEGAVNDEVEIDIGGGQCLVAIVTSSSREGLGLHVGAEVFALIKASSVILVADVADARFSARNRLSGRIGRIVPGAVNTEVVLDLPQGSHLAAVVTHASAKALALREGGMIVALFKASSVILAVPA